MIVNSAVITKILICQTLRPKAANKGDAAGLTRSAAIVRRQSHQRQQYSDQTRRYDEDDQEANNAKRPPAGQSPTGYEGSPNAGRRRSQQRQSQDQPEVQVENHKREGAVEQASGPALTFSSSLTNGGTATFLVKIDVNPSWPSGSNKIK
jgi:hypothetical protein